MRQLFRPVLQVGVDDENARAARKRQAPRERDVIPAMRDRSTATTRATA
jgi:hypothetical protein